MGTIHLKYFGVITDITNKTSEMVENPSNIENLLTELSKKYPELQTSRFQVSVNQNIVNENVVLHDRDEVALLPPFAGG